MATKHEWARDWFGTKRPPKPEDLEEAPPGPPPILGVQLLYEREPRLDADLLLGQLRKNCGTALLAEHKNDLQIFKFPDCKGNLWGKSDVPFQCTIATAVPAVPMADLETSLSQTRDWPRARAVAETCKAMIVVHDLMANWHDPRQRLAMFQKVVRSLLEITSCAAIHWIPSLRLVEPKAFLRSQESGEHRDPLFGAVNIRAFRMEDGAPGEMCMDTMGLARLGLPDVQCHCIGWNPAYVADALYAIAGFVFETGKVPQPGEVFESERFPGLICRAAMALVRPERAVVNIEPTEELAASWLPQTRVGAEQVTAGVGKNIFHDKPKPPNRSVAPATRADYDRRREQVYQSLFGPIQQIHDDRGGAVPPIKVYVFGPGPGGRDFFTLVTGGMSDLPMHLPPDAPARVPTRLELILYAREPKPEYIEGLRTTARFPHDYQTCLGWGHTIPNGQPPSPIFQGSKLTGILLVQSPLSPDRNLSEKLILEDEPVEILWLVPLTTAELVFKRDHGTEKLLDLFDQVQHPFILDEKRDSYAPDAGTPAAAPPAKPASHVLSYARVQDGIFYHGTVSDLDGQVRATWSFDEGGQRVTRDLPITKDAFLFLRNGIAQMGVFERWLVRAPGQEVKMDPMNYHCIIYEEPGQQSSFMIPPAEADQDFARWLAALHMPRSADAPLPPAPAGVKNQQPGAPKKPWWKVW
jgi:hypothetical protein